MQASAPQTLFRLRGLAGERAGAWGSESTPAGRSQEA